MELIHNMSDEEINLEVADVLKVKEINLEKPEKK